MALALNIGRQALVVFGVGYSSLFFLENKEGLLELVSELSQAITRTVSGTGASVARSADPVVDALAAQMDRLSDEVRRLSQRGFTVVHAGGKESDYSYIIYPTTVGLGAAAYCRWKGYSLGDLMYVTKSGFKAGLTGVATTITKVKKELVTKLDEFGVRLSDVDEGVRRIQGEVEGTRLQLGNVETSIGRLEDGQAASQDKLDFAVGGIGLLCNTLSDVVEQIQPNTGRANQLRHFVAQLPPSAAVKALAPADHSGAGLKALVGPDSIDPTRAPQALRLLRDQSFPLGRP